jgi:hypothetical protein
MTRKRRSAVAGIVVLGALAASTTAAGKADAALNPLQVKLLACGSGSSAVWNDLNPVLKAGTASQGQCGAPSAVPTNPAYAEVEFLDEAQGVVPTTEPVFKASAYGSGAPRMEIVLDNGKKLAGYPGRALTGQSGPDPAGMAWAVGNSSTIYTNYATAYKTAGASSTLVKSAYIVEDARQQAGPVNTLTDVQYDGKPIGAGTVIVPPVAPQTVTVGEATPVLTVMALTTSSDPNGLTIGVTGLPDGLSYNAAKHTITGTPASDAKGGDATVTATDAYGEVGTSTIAYTVKPKSAPVPVLSHGKAVATAPTRETVTWQQTIPSWERFTIVGPGAINGHVGWVPPGTEVGYYSGLEAHHGYTVTYTPYTAKGGSPIQGAHPGAVYFVS